MSDDLESRFFVALIKNRARPVFLEMEVATAFQLVSQLQLALRHPGNQGPGAKSARALVDQIGEALGSVDPIFADLVARGNRPECDVPAPNGQPVSGEGEFFLLSLKHSPCEDYALWWGPNDSGYVTRLEEAGRYSKAEIEAHRDRYNNGVQTIALPVETVFVVAERSHRVPWSSFRSNVKGGGA